MKGKTTKRSSFNLNQTHVYLLAILVLTTVLYIPVFKNAITNWDDELYIINNPYIQNLSFENIGRIFSSFFAGNYHPLTMLSLAVNYMFGGVQPWAYHFTNLIFHLFNTLLVFVFIKRLLEMQGHSQKNLFVPALTALLFGIHTLQVESVAWISEQKNVLYAFFFLTSLIIYTEYLKKEKPQYYAFSLVLFVLSLFAKGMAISLSLSIIVVDYFAGRNLLSKKVILEKIPFLALSIVFGIIAIYAQHSGDAILSGDRFSWINRIAVASYGFFEYLIKLAFPVQLSAYYPYPTMHGSSLPVYFYLCIPLVLLLLFVIWKYAKHQKEIMFGTLFFVANISFVIQLLPVGNAVMADRYVYIPSIGFFLILAFLLNTLWQKQARHQKTIITIIIVYCLLLCINTRQRVGIWKDSLTLWNDAIKKCPENNDRGYQNRGNIYFDMGNYSEALQDYTRLMQIAPNNDAAYIGLGRIKLISGDQDGALLDFNKALSINKSYEGYINRSVIKINIKDFAGAMADADSAWQINPYKAAAIINKGYISFLTGNYTDALDKYNQAIQLDPQNSKLYFARARIKQALNDFTGACFDLNQAAQMGNNMATEELMKNCK
jgi:tetratricopeptide (TPR) repeat protein